MNLKKLKQHLYQFLFVQEAIEQFSYAHDNLHSLETSRKFTIKSYLTMGTLKHSRESQTKIKKTFALNTVFFFSSNNIIISVHLKMQTKVAFLTK